MKKTLNVLAIAIVFALTGTANAEDLTVPHTFSPGTTIKSSEVNENFLALYQKINEMQATINRLSGYHIPTDGLVAYYPFNGNANDESGNGNHGTVNGATLTTDRFGNTNSSYSFDGVDDYVSQGDLNNINISSSVTMSVWIYKKNDNDGIPSENIMSIVQSSGSSQPHLGILYSDEKIRAQTKDNTDTWGLNNTFSDTAVPMESWHNLVFSFSKPNYIFYLDGVPDGSGTWDNNIKDNDSSPYLYIGTRGDLHSSYFFTGLIDNIRIYNRALSEPEVQTLYNLEKP